MRQLRAILAAATMTFACAAQAGDSDIIVESFADGYNFEWFEKVEGNWIESTAKSIADGLVATKALFNTADTNAGCARFKPEIPTAGPYEVFVTYPRSGNAAGVLYKVMSADGEKVITQDQNGRAAGGEGPPDTWISLGVHRFEQGRNGHIDIFDPATGTAANPQEPNVRVYADAVKLVPQGFALPDTYANSRTGGAATAASAPSGPSAPATGMPGLGAANAPAIPGLGAANAPAMPGLGAVSAPQIPGLAAAGTPAPAPSLPPLTTGTSPEPAPTPKPALTEEEVKAKLAQTNAQLDAVAAGLSGKPIPAEAQAYLQANPPGGVPALPALSPQPGLPSLASAGTEAALPPAPSGVSLPTLPSVGATASESQPGTVASTPRPTLVATPEPAPSGLPALPGVATDQPVASLPPTSAAPAPSALPTLPGTMSGHTVAALPPVSASPAATPAYVPPPPDPALSILPWNLDLGAAQTLARQQQKKILILFTAPGNRVIERLDRDVFPSPTIKAAFDNFVLVRVDFPRNSRMAYRLGIFGAGTIAIIEPNGDAVKAIVNPPGTAEELVSALNAPAPTGRPAGPQIPGAPVAAAASAGPPPVAPGLPQADGAAPAPIPADGAASAGPPGLPGLPPSTLPPDGAAPAAAMPALPMAGEGAPPAVAPAAPPVTPGLPALPLPDAGAPPANP